MLLESINGKLPSKICFDLQTADDSLFLAPK